MKVLWITNTIYPSVAEKIECDSRHAISWVDAMANCINNDNRVELAIFFPGYISSFKKVVENNISFYVSSNEKSMKDDIDFVIKDFKPDIIHMYGTEEKHNFYILEKYKNIPTIISLQGIISGYIDHYFGGLSYKEIMETTTYGIAEVILKRGIFWEYNKWKKQIPYEKEIIKNVKYIEGRSDWDEAVSRAINPYAKYYYLPRAIREGFYKYNWNPQMLNKHTLFVHQGNCPRKGVHFLLEAVSLLRREFPDIKLYISGDNPFIRGKVIKGYNRFLYKVIKDLKLQPNICFTGKLSDDRVAKRLSVSSICVVTSSIDNAANAIAESMIVGTPVLSSYVGGSPDMLGYGEYGFLYTYNEAELLASRIKYMFKNQEEVIKKAANAKKVAYERHDIENLKEKLINIYYEIEKDSVK